MIRTDIGMSVRAAEKYLIIQAILRPDGLTIRRRIAISIARYVDI